MVQALCQDWDAELIEMNGEDDHVHLLLGLNPKCAPSIVANNFKTGTSRLLRKQFHHPKPDGFADGTLRARPAMDGALRRVSVDGQWSRASPSGKRRICRWKEPGADELLPGSDRSLPY
jgi:transposase IS200 family protein